MLPTSRSWFAAAILLQSVLIDNADSASPLPARHFSAALCAQLIGSAVAAYKADVSVMLVFMYVTLTLLRITIVAICLWSRNASTPT
jgi:hypothetical protein